MPVLQSWRTEVYVSNLHVYLIILATKSQIYKNCNLQYSNSTRAGEMRNSKSKGPHETQAES